MRVKHAFAVVLMMIALGCSKEEPETTTQAKVEPRSGVAVPYGADDPSGRERERFDERWRQLLGFRDARIAARRAVAARLAEIRFAPAGKETFEGVAPGAINDTPVVIPLKGDVSGPSVLKTQVYLDRVSFSMGVLDGRWGRNTAIALWWYQRSRGIEAQEAGALDEQTFRTLATEAGAVPALVQHTVTAEDVKGPFVDVPEDMYDKAELKCLCYESRAEKLAERFHASVELLETLNPGDDLSSVQEGDVVLVPNVRAAVTEARPDIAKIVISIRGNTFNAFDASGNLIFHAPTTLGSKYDPSPSETLEIEKIAFDPHFHYQPTLFAEVPDTEPEANLNPGPNSPVGVVWIALSKPHYGIHGTSDPDAIGYASSHGCVRLTNWDAHEVGHRAQKGVRVEFMDTGSG